MYGLNFANLFIFIAEYGVNFIRFALFNRTFLPLSVGFRIVVNRKEWFKIKLFWLFNFSDLS